MSVMELPVSHIVLVIMGLIPSLVWMAYFLRRDPHPEPRSLLAKTFLMGIILSPLAVLLQIGFSHYTEIIDSIQLINNKPSFFLWAALIEECVKFFAVWFIVLNKPDFDEPIDAMIYLIVAGLGFAAIENILVLFRAIPGGPTTTLAIWGLRFIGATLLHALSSSILGYFLGLSWFYQHHKTKLILIGIAIATLFHFSFNLFLSSLDQQVAAWAAATGVLLIMAFLVSILFVKIRERHRTIVALAAAEAAKHDAIVV